MRKIVAVLMMCLIFAGCGSRPTSELKTLGKEAITVLDKFQNGKLGSDAASNEIDALMEKVNAVQTTNDDESLLATSIWATLGTAQMEILQADVVDGNDFAESLNNIKFDDTIQYLKELID